jgi:hypothetical protein
MTRHGDCHCLRPPCPALAAFYGWRRALIYGERATAAAWLARLEGWLNAPKWRPSDDDQVAGRREVNRLASNA